MLRQPCSKVCFSARHSALPDLRRVNTAWLKHNVSTPACQYIVKLRMPAPAGWHQSISLPHPLTRVAWCACRRAPTPGPTRTTYSSRRARLPAPTPPPPMTMRHKRAEAAWQRTRQPGERGGRSLRRRLRSATYERASAACTRSQLQSSNGCAACACTCIV